ncbi:DnaJ-like protein [Porphyridium purpureum]|uniref:DnaJ-like protein n=1 Tax=Porphyridium purpureum TaxID=35688 RepID=A0A5J4YIY7_PORPP|nr:DnaJ-like protein [Porphyridium purpureum]|eukprot:POR2108..scf297_16
MGIFMRGLLRSSAPVTVLRSKLIWRHCGAIFERRWLAGLNRGLGIHGEQSEDAPRAWSSRALHTTRRSEKKKRSKYASTEPDRPKTLYEILGVEPNASKDEIRIGYRKMFRRYRPEAFRPNPQMFVLVGRAYLILSDDLMRKTYDAYGTYTVADKTFSDADHVVVRTEADAEAEADEEADDDPNQSDGDVDKATARDPLDDLLPVDKEAEERAAAEAEDDLMPTDGAPDNESNIDTMDYGYGLYEAEQEPEKEIEKDSEHAVEDGDVGADLEVQDYEAHLGEESDRIEPGEPGYKLPYDYFRQNPEKMIGRQHNELMDVKVSLLGREPGIFEKRKRYRVDATCVPCETSGLAPDRRSVPCKVCSGTAHNPMHFRVPCTTRDHVHKCWNPRLGELQCPIDFAAGLHAQLVGLVESIDAQTDEDEHKHSFGMPLPSLAHVFGGVRTVKMVGTSCWGGPKFRAKQQYGRVLAP